MRVQYSLDSSLDTLKIHKWMVGYTRQTEWIERRGIFLWIAFYSGGLAGGLYLVSLFFNSLLGMFISWLIMGVIKGGAHFVYLGKPLRVWRIIAHPQTSWLSRGFIFVLSFVGFGAIQLALSYWMAGSAAEIAFKVLTAIAAFCVTFYTGVILMNVKGVPFWNSVLLPVLFVACGLLGGFGLAVIISLTAGGIDLHTAEAGSRWLLVINALLIIAYLWQVSRREVTAKLTVLQQIKGENALAFWLGVVIMGIIIPLAIAITGMVSDAVPSSVLLFGVACEIIGGLSLRYCVLRGGAYKPLVARGTAA
ncbi:MAG: polysulfide reductase NrfD [Dehalococcoidales bacterium]|nr:polysulfide reductase NrfD [Dehalococcoidales bacterium]